MATPRMKLQNLIRHLGDQLNVPLDQLEQLNINDFVETAIKGDAGQAKNVKVSPSLLT